MPLAFEQPKTDIVSHELLKSPKIQILRVEGGMRDEESSDFSTLLSSFNEKQALQDHAI